MPQIAEILINYGAIGGLLGYFVYKDNVHSKKAEESSRRNNENMTKALDQVNDTLLEVKETINIVKELVFNRGAAN